MRRAQPIKNRGNIRGALDFRGMFVHAWDFMEGATSPLEWMRRIGLNTICFASTYHSGWFLHPGSRSHRLFMAESGVTYFQPDSEFFKKTRLVPKPATITKGVDILSRVSRLAMRNGLQVVAWTVGAHNTRLGSANPDLTQQNAYGDRIPHALCFSNTEVRDYLVNICRNIALRYPVNALQLEAFGWMTSAHGHHHERDLIGLNEFEQQLMGLCLCGACCKQARAAGVDTSAIKQRVRSLLEGVLAAAPRRPKNHPRSMAELESAFSEIKRFNQWRHGAATRLISQIKTEALAGTNCKLMLQSEFDPACAPYTEGFACSAYGHPPREVHSVCRKARAACPPDWTGTLQCFIQLGAGTPRSEHELRQIIEGVRNGGCNGINFYNHSESPPQMLKWLSRTLPSFA